MDSSVIIGDESINNNLSVTSTRKKTVTIIEPSMGISDEISSFVGYFIAHLVLFY
jgi:hypothetical protein